MTTLTPFPLISQQTKISADGSSPNAEMDCVPTSILAGLMYLHGVTQLDKTWDPDRLLDMAYPEGYKGSTSASEFVKACATFGCTLFPLNGTNVALVQDIHAHIQAGHPCIVTVPDVYVPASYGWTHVLCAFGEEPGQITMLDPWPGKPVTKSDAEWEGMLRDNQIWVLQKNTPAPPVEEIMTIDLNNQIVARYFELASPDGTQWRSRIDVTGQGKYPILKDGMLAFYRSFGGNALCGLTYLGLPLSYEIPLPGGAEGATMQYFERGVLAYDPSHAIDNPPGSSAVYLMHLYSGAGQDPRLASLTQQTSTLATQVKQLQTQLASSQQDLQSALSATNTALQQELASAQARIASALAALQ